MNILITGGTGFIGSHLTEILIDEGHNVSIISNTHVLPEYLIHCKGNINLHQGDFGDKSILRKAVTSETDIVIHLAWSSIPQSSVENPVFDIQSDLIGSINLIDHCVKMKIRKFIFISSGGTVYGIPKSVPIAENHPTNSICSYGLTKLAVEKYLYLYHHLKKLPYTIIRPSNAYGERQNLNKGQGVIGIWLKKILDGETIEIWGDGNIQRDYIYVSDLIHAIKITLENDYNRHIFNVGAGIGTSLNDIVKIFKSDLKLDFEVHYKEKRLFDVPVSILDTSLIKNKTGWKMQTDIIEGIKKEWQWIQSQK